jgi:hypothetical protein
MGPSKEAYDYVAFARAYDPTARLYGTRGTALATTLAERAQLFYNVMHGIPRAKYHSGGYGVVPRYQISPWNASNVERDPA